MPADEDSCESVACFACSQFHFVMDLLRRRRSRLPGISMRYSVQAIFYPLKLICFAPQALAIASYFRRPFFCSHHRGRALDNEVECVLVAPASSAGRVRAIGFIPVCPAVLTNGDSKTSQADRVSGSGSIALRTSTMA